MKRGALRRTWRSCRGWWRKDCNDASARRAGSKAAYTARTLIGLRASLISLCALLSLGAQAQIVTDVELRAAYCAGASTVQIEMLERSANEPKNKLIRDSLMRSLSEDRERNKRYLDYLKVKLPSVDERFAALPALKLASRHGQQDVQTCQNEPGYGACTGRCFDNLQSVEEGTACLNKCPSPPSCSRVRKCLEDFLPF